MSPLPWLTLYSELRNPTAGAVGHRMSPLTRLRILEGTWLLNCFPGYDYLKANEADERNAVQRFCNTLTGSHAKATSGN